jgi:hypothetical protein
MRLRDLRLVGLAVSLVLGSLTVGSVSTAEASTPKSCAALIASYQHPTKKMTNAQAEGVGRTIARVCSSMSILKGGIHKLEPGAPKGLIAQVANAVKDAVCAVPGNNGRLCR